MAWYAHSQRVPARLSRRSLLRALALACATPASALLSACWGGGDDDDEAPTAFVDSQATTAPPPGPGTPPPSPTERADATTMTPATPDEPTATRSRSSTATRTATLVRNTPTPTPSGPNATTAAPTSAPTATAPTPAVGGTLRLLSFAAPYILNPHLAQNTPSVIAGRIALEPLFDFDAELNPILVLGAEWPTVPRGLLDPFGRWVIWRLRPGVRWHDGELFSASDVRFTWEYATSGVSIFVNPFGDVVADIEIIDPSAVRLVFTRPNPNWIDLFRGGRGVILPEHVFRPTMDSLNQQAELANLMPTGTGPWRVVDNSAQEGWVRFERFADYWDVGKPYCDEVIYLGGGSAEIHAQSVLREGGAEWASFLTSVDPVVLAELAAAGEGVLAQPQSSLVERLHFNFSAPGSGMDGSALTPHPLFSDLRVRRALALAMPRDEIAADIWGPSGVAETHILASPPGFQGPGVPYGPDLDAARVLLNEVGVSSSELTILTTIGGPNAPRTLTVQRMAMALEALGFSVTVREIDSALFFAPGADTADSLSRFAGDLAVYAHGGSPYPLDWARRYRSDEIAQEANRWAGENIARYNNPAFDALHDQAQQAIDPELQRELWQRMMTLVEEDIVEIPIVRRFDLAAVSNRVGGWSVSGWAENPSYDLKNWRLAAG